MIRHLIPALLLGTALIGHLSPAAAQSVGPTREGAPLAPQEERWRRFELGLYYGFATFTARYSDVQWSETAASSPDMDLATTPSIGGFFAYGLGSRSRLTATVTRQSTRIEAGGADAPGTWRTDMSLLHLHLGFEQAWRGGDVQPYVTVAGGGMLATAKDLDEETWFYSAMAGLGVRYQRDPRFSVRAMLRVPALLVDGQVIWQFDPGLAVTWAF